MCCNNGVAITLDGELTGPKAKTDFHQRVRLEKKDQVRKEIGHSPDGADALATTFAETVHAPNPLGMPDLGSPVTDRAVGY